MEDTQSVANLLDYTTSKIQQLQKAFAELESHRALTLNLKWKELEAHFHGLEKSLKRRFYELEDQEKEYETKTLEAQEMLEKRTAAVLAKEHLSLERLQENRDASMFAISNAREKHRKVSSVQHAVVFSEGKCGASSQEEKPPDFETSEGSTIEEANTPVDDGSVEVNSTDKITEVKSYPQLLKICREMDSVGLHNFVSDNRKNLATIRDEIPFALKAAADPGRLVLDSLDNFYLGDVINLDAKKDSCLLGLRRTCIMLMECLSILFMNLDPVSVTTILSPDVKARAKAIAKEWKPKLGELDLDANNGNSLEAHAFLQLLATFSIASDFDEEELSKLIPMVSRRRQAADLCRSLGLSEKMPGVIEVLIGSGRHMDAVNLTFAFQLTEQFPPVPLLKSFLKDARKAASPKPGNVSPSSPSAQIDVNERELTALKAVMKCVEEHKLENYYPLDTLQKRTLQLEKAKADKKRATEAGKPQSKRPRANSSGSMPRSINVAADKTPYATRPADRTAYPQYIFDRQYAYPMPTDSHCTPHFGTPAYGIPPGHGAYFGNGYPYQAAYLH